MDTAQERRGTQRVQVDWPVTLFNNDVTIEGESRNISEKGLYIYCDKPLPLNQVFRIAIQPPQHQAIGFTGKVIWSDLYGMDNDKSVFGVGLCLVEISEDEQDLLRELISNYL